MKKILSIIGAVAVSSTATTSVVACDNKGGNPTPQPTYDSVEDAIKSLNLISYSKVGSTNLSDLSQSIVFDIYESLMQVNFKEGVKFEVPIGIDPNDILIGTKKNYARWLKNWYSFTT